MLVVVPLTPATTCYSAGIAGVMYTRTRDFYFLTLVARYLSTIYPSTYGIDFSMDRVINAAKVEKAGRLM